MWNHKLLSFKISTAIHKRTLISIKFKKIFKKASAAIFFITEFTNFLWKPHPPFIKMQLNGMTSLVINRNILTAVSSNIKQKSTENQPSKAQHTHTVVCNIFLHSEFIKGMKSYIGTCAYLPVVLFKLCKINFYTWS